MTFVQIRAAVIGVVALLLLLSVVFWLPPAAPANINDVPGTTSTGTQP